MGSGASTADLLASTGLPDASIDQISDALDALPEAEFAKLKAAMQRRSGAAAAAGEAEGEMPKHWPKQPFEPEDLRLYVLEATKPTAQEKWDEHLALRSVGESQQDHVADKAFANLLLNKEGTGEAKEGRHHDGIDPEAYKHGKWYRFLNHKGDCYVFVHNYTRDITATKPDNFKELTPEELAFLKKLGCYIKELPSEIERIYTKEKKIPIIYGSQSTCEAMKNFFVFDTYCHLMDASKLKRVDTGALEECRSALVTAMKNGQKLMIYCGDVLPDFLEKICITKFKDKFPLSLFTHGGMENELVREKIYLEGDKEGGQCAIREGFMVCIMIMYDSMGLAMSSMLKDELPGKIPEFERMQEVRVYNDEDKLKALEEMRDGKK
eukprot:TRINITY_DN105244_c0_g1_i1.p1 TRINITY_DN105244_c0_g1~~TRINITY_DN105244_c0_g1_i1.p1  ORF type:complete len:381 (-),score=103.00 TRINITY_DN105244_c0_g1_i1:82-1224(-)